MLMLKHTPLFILLFLLTGCLTPKVKDSYVKTTSYNLNVEHIFMPPSDEYHPFSLLHHSKKSGYTVLCSASILSGIPEENLSKELKENNIADAKLASGSHLKFDISLSKADVGSTGLNHKNIKFLMVTLTNGKKITMPSMHMYTAQENLANSQCKKEISIYLDSHKDSKYYIPNSIYRYTIKTTILDHNHVDITAQIPTSLKQLIFAKASVQKNSIGSMNFSGENLYIGFNGVTLTHKFSPIIPKNLSNDEIIFDATKMIQKIRKDK